MSHREIQEVIFVGLKSSVKNFKVSLFEISRTKIVALKIFLVRFTKWNFLIKISKEDYIFNNFSSDLTCKYFQGQPTNPYAIDIDID